MLFVIVVFFWAYWISSGLFDEIHTYVQAALRDIILLQSNEDGSKMETNYGIKQHIFESNMKGSVEII